MSSTVLNEVRRGFYLDSVALMRLSAQLCERPDVDEAVLMIGTPSNHAIMEDAGLLTDDGRDAGPNDLVIALRAHSEDGAREALDAAGAALASGLASAGSGETVRPRSIDGALQIMTDANLALISTPGEFATREARTALARGMNVMMFSDNVSLDDEKSLKRDATNRGLLLMGPDCGTAYIAGTPLAFTNRVPRGNVGVIAASGTGLQEFAVLLSRLGAGISHGIGVGGRDLSDAVGGLSTLTAIDLLASDESTQQVVLISKPPGPATAEKVFAKLASSGKPVTVCVFGGDASAIPDALTAAATIKQAAERVSGRTLDVEGFDMEALACGAAGSVNSGRRWIRGLYSGGTLCVEAQLVLQQAGLAMTSNAPVATSTPQDDGAAPGHSILDLGADEYTVGRPHPMIEPTVRSAPLSQALADPACAVVLLDLVLGNGAHPDPAGAVADAISAAPVDRPCIIASVCGTPEDPQGLAHQVRTLEAAGVILAPSNADAATLAAKAIP